MLEEQHADAADEEEMFETTHTHMDTPAMTLSAFWPGPQIESPFNPAAHSWIMVPNEEAAPVADEVAGDVDRADEDNRVLASLGNLAPPLNAATLPSPATSEVAQLVEGARTSGFGASEADIPDGVPAWTQQCGTALQDQMSASMDWVHAQCEGEQAAGSLHACSATGPASKHVRASLDTAAGAHKRQLHSEGEGSKLSALIANACSSDVKWLLITHAATLIVGVYFGHAWSSASSSKSTVCAPSTGAREALPQPRVA